MNSEMKLCKDCKHFRPYPDSGRALLNLLIRLLQPEFVRRYGTCDKAKIIHEEVSFVDGKVQTKVKPKYASICREFGPCGPDGKWWEAKR